MARRAPPLRWRNTFDRMSTWTRLMKNVPTLDIRRYDTDRAAFQKSVEAVKALVKTMSGLTD